MQELGKLFKHSFTKVQDLMVSLQDTEDKARRVGKLEHDCATFSEELKRKSKSLQDLEYHLEQVITLVCTSVGSVHSSILKYSFCSPWEMMCTYQDLHVHEVTKTVSKLI